ncbi:hypothetical protein SIPHO054v2_p0030 [Vibrio phage 103E44.1]|nr:hypothetical protein SIPHO054v2_p0030 [Vibrio phage 103E44.1]QZI87884.1 hypothetical protein SIPHO055v2_p0029 [Vibrio phage 104E43.1]
MTAHSVYSFSSSSRWIEDACPASIRMSRMAPRSETNPAAELGTAVHELSEFCFHYGVMPYDCIGMTFNNHVIDESMANASAVYVNWGKHLMVQTGQKAMIEQRVTMSSLGRTDVFGTSDFTLVAGNVLHIGDYKNGRGIVEPSSSQLAGYAVATLDTFNLWGQITEVHRTIVQPNAPHEHGPIRTVVEPIQSMYDWQQKFYRSVMLADDDNQRPVAGTHCTWCLASGFCRARTMRTIELSHLDKPIDVITAEEAEIMLKEQKVMERNLSMIAVHALNLARKGEKFTDHKLVTNYGRASLNDENALIEDVKLQGVDLDKMYEKKIVSMTKARKLLPDDLVNKHWTRPEPSTTLAPMHDKRPAIRTKVTDGVFSDMTIKPTPSTAGVFGDITQ